LRKKLGGTEVELRDALRLIEELEQKNWTSKKNNDSDDRSANSEHTDYDELKTKLGIIETQMRSLEIANLSRELKGLSSAYYDLDKRHEQAVDQKKVLEEKLGFELCSKAEKEKKPRVVKCTQRYTENWPCDAGHSCQACIARGIPGGCKRVKYPHSQHFSFKWGGEFPGGRVRPEQEQKKVDGELTEALPTAASPTAASSLSPANAASKKRGRGHEDAGEGEESTERVRLNIAAPNPDHDNVSTLAFVLDETTMQQAHIFQEPQRPNFTDEEAEPEDNTCLSFEAFTIRPQFEY
ncbi:hypothetical protein PSPO01_07888, partial [Paraphaeosphaeria sporulosa]